MASHRFEGCLHFSDIWVTAWEIQSAAAEGAYTGHGPRPLNWTRLIKQQVQCVWLGVAAGDCSDALNITMRRSAPGLMARESPTHLCGIIILFGGAFSLPNRHQRPLHSGLLCLLRLHWGCLSRWGCSAQWL